MHNKLMVADNAAVLIGGRNIGDIYYGVNTIANYRDWMCWRLGLSSAICQTVRPILEQPDRTDRGHRRSRPWPADLDGILFAYVRRSPRLTTLILSSRPRRVGGQERRASRSRMARPIIADDPEAIARRKEAMTSSNSFAGGSPS
jgi:putative cardiolipin synthase